MWGGGGGYSLLMDDMYVRGARKITEGNNDLKKGADSVVFKQFSLKKSTQRIVDKLKRRIGLTFSFDKKSDHILVHDKILCLNKKSNQSFVAIQKNNKKQEHIHIETYSFLYQLFCFYYHIY